MVQLDLERSFFNDPFKWLPAKLQTIVWPGHSSWRSPSPWQDQRAGHQLTQPRPNACLKSYLCEPGFLETQAVQPHPTPGPPGHNSAHKSTEFMLHLLELGCEVCCWDQIQLCCLLGRGTVRQVTSKLSFFSTCRVTIPVSLGVFMRIK